jgi:hypothetical protein
LTEERSASRFRKEPESSYAVLLHPQQEILAEVYDESLGGLAVCVARGAAFAVGQELNVIYLGSFLHARVVRVEPRGDGRFLVAFACQPLLPRERRWPTSV